MLTQEWRTVDKSGWGPGPWEREPDKKQWQDAATGLPCLAVRNPGGAWCGYVGVPPGHPAHGKHYDAVEVLVHGGLTFSDPCDEPTPEAWERWRKNVRSRADEARQYPLGDMARLLRERSVELEDYAAFRAHQIAASICHVPEPGEPDVWWLGFDCSHLGDASPAYREHRSLAERDYRRLVYVEHQVASLARQLAAMALPDAARGEGEG